MSAGDNVALVQYSALLSQIPPTRKCTEGSISVSQRAWDLYSHPLAPRIGHSNTL